MISNDIKEISITCCDKKKPINYDDNKTQKAIVLKKVINYVYLSLFGKI